MSRPRSYDRALDALLLAEEALTLARRRHERAPGHASRAALSVCLRDLRRIAATETMAFRALPQGSGVGVWR